MSEAPVRVAFRGSLEGFRLDAAFTAPGAGVTALFGPSGCGKTTILRCIAGLERFRDGSCSVGGVVWQDGERFVPAHRRAVGFVFQEASLFAHLSVRANLRYGAGGAPIDVEVVRLLGLEPLLERSPGRLSGGERQRVAIGRALLSRPALLLMDEPLAALDQAAREEILPFLERLHATTSVPILYVSHDMGEVERLADHIVLLESGRVVGAGALATLQSDLAMPLVGRRDAAVSLDGVVSGYDAGYGLLAVAVAGGVFLVPSAPAAAGERRRVRIAARDVSLALEPAASTILNVLPARIRGARPVDGVEWIATVGLGADGAGAQLLVRCTRQSWERLGLAEGMAVQAQVKAVAIR